jgi:hypothetical protein
MLGIYRNGNHPGPASSLWTINDLCDCAELAAPMFTHAFFPHAQTRWSISLDATEFPWSNVPPISEDSVSYSVLRTATLVVLNSGMRLAGAAKSRLRSFPDQLGTVYDGWCIGSDVAFEGCPAAGQDVLLAETTVVVPPGHPGVVMFLAKTRVQAGWDDAGGSARLWMTVDGAQRGSIGVQQLAPPSTISQRTISASYLTAGNERLPPGPHTVQLYGRADGSFLHLVYYRDLPLLWFD